MTLLLPKVLRWPALAASVLLLWPSCLSAKALEKLRTPAAQDSVPMTSSDNLFESPQRLRELPASLPLRAGCHRDGRTERHCQGVESSTDASIAVGLSEDDSKTWSDVLFYYRAKMLNHDLASDEDLVKIKNRLEDMEDATSVNRSDLDPKLIAVLDAAAPIYRAHWWFLHNTANQKWIAAVMPLVDKQGSVLAQQKAMAFETQWPDRPLRVDVVAYANYAGSYTTLGPARITISSIDGGNQGTAALEVLFHAAAAVMIDAAGHRQAGLEKAKRDPPPEITPMILWFTSGFLVQQLYPNYTMYADRFALWTKIRKQDTARRGQGSAAATGIKMTLDAALARLAANFSVAAAPERRARRQPHPVRRLPTSAEINAGGTSPVYAS